MLKRTIDYLLMLSWIAALILILSACTTTAQAPLQKLQIDASLRVVCEPLPKITASVGDDLREAILLNRVASDAVHDDCAARHRAVLRAVGVEVIEFEKGEK